MYHSAIWTTILVHQRNHQSVYTLLSFIGQENSTGDKQNKINLLDSFRDLPWCIVFRRVVVVVLLHLFFLAIFCKRSSPAHKSLTQQTRAGVAVAHMIFLYMLMCVVRSQLFLYTSGPHLLIYQTHTRPIPDSCALLNQAISTSLSNVSYLQIVQSTRLY